MPSKKAESDASGPDAGSRARFWGLSSLGLGSIALAVVLGVFSGAGVFTFGYGRGASYLSNDPKSCVHCHVMQGHFDSWTQSSHHHVAVCNDCHLPHNLAGKYLTKADNGFFHSLAFTLQDYHEPIRIKPRNSRVAQQSCVHCHQDFVHAVLPPDASLARAENPLPQQETLSCVHCHADVGHAHR